MKKIISVILIAFVLFTTSCKKEQCAPVELKASFTSPIDALGGSTVTFTNTSTGATSYTWDFGDGTATETTTSPTHVFNSSGYKTVTLTATNGAVSAKASTKIYIYLID